MKTWFAIADIVALILILFILDTDYQILSTQEEEYNEIRLTRAVEYASEAAFTTAISQTNTGLSYLTGFTEDSYNVPLATRNTLETFETVLACNYGLSLCDDTFATIEDAIGVMMLAASDGYYITDRTQVSEDGTGLVWTIKKPYSYETQVGEDTYVTYALTLNTESFIRVEVKGNDSTSDYSYTSGISYASTGGEMTDDIRRTAISGLLTDAVGYYMEKNIGRDPSVAFFVPSTQTLSGINQIYAPTLLVIMDDCKFAGVEQPGSAALTGNRIMQKIRVIGYTRDGGKYYSYEYQGATDDESVEVLEAFDTIEEAAAAGYAPDLQYLCSAISYDRKGDTSSGEVKTEVEYTVFDPEASYTRGDYVLYHGITYMCISDTTGPDFDPACWREETEDENFEVINKSGAEDTEEEEEISDEDSGNTDDGGDLDDGESGAGD